MIRIEQYQGTEPQLYTLVAPLVMNPVVLKQNYNFPFRTSEHFEWLVAIEEEEVIGFFPIENRRFEWVLNNYYVKDKNPEILTALVQHLNHLQESADTRPQLVAVCFIEDAAVFNEAEYREEKVWKRYAKMRRK